MRALGDRVRFVGRTDDVPGTLRALDVLVNVSAAEPFGLSVLEAQATGVAVVGTAAGGIPDFVADDDNGLLVPPGDAAALAAALARLVTDPSLRARLAARGRVSARSGAPKPGRRLCGRVSARRPGAVAGAGVTRTHGDQVRPLARQRRGEAAHAGARRPLARRAELVLCAYDDGSADAGALERWASTCAACRGDRIGAGPGGLRPDPERHLGPVLARPRSPRWSGPRPRGSRRPPPGGVPPDGADVAWVSAARRVLDLHNVESSWCAATPARAL